MALPSLTSSDAGATARGKINAAIEQLNALVTGLGVVDGGLYSYDHPGEGPQYFTTDVAVREPNLYPDLPGAQIVGGAEGRAYRFIGSGWCVSRQFWPVTADDTYRAATAWARSAAPSDPSGDTIRFGLLCYDAGRTQIADLVLRDWSSAPIGARQSHTGFFSRVDRGLPDVTILLSGTRLVRPYVRAFGGAQTTDLELLAWNNGGSNDGSGGPGGGGAEAAVYAAQALNSRNQASASASSAAASAIASASAAPGYALRSQLFADLNWPEGTAKQVIADPESSTATAGNGTYIKTGASGTGSWSKRSDATVPGLDARTRPMSGRADITGSLEVWRARGTDGLWRRVAAILRDGIEIAGHRLRRRSDTSGAAVRWRVRDERGRHRSLGGILLDGGWRIGLHILRPRRGDLVGGLVVRDRLGRRLLSLRGDGRWLAKMCDVDGVPYARIDGDPSGGLGLLTTRVNRALDPYGLPLAEVYRPEYLREAHQRLAVLRDYGGQIDSINCQYSVLFQGDSWSTTWTFYVGWLAKLLAAKYGDAGPGYTGFAFSQSNTVNGNARPDVLFYAFSGSWVSTYGTAPMPDHSLVTSGAAGDTITLTYTKPATGPNISAVKVFAIAGGTAQYRINGGAWTAFDLTGSGFKLLDCGTIPAGNFTLEIQALSAGVRLGGADYRSTAKGVRVHKGGSSGTRSRDWVTGDAAIYQAALAALAPNTLSLLSGTNSQGPYVADIERDYVQTLITRWKAALPYADLMLATPPENNRVNARPMSDYAAAHRRLAYDNGLTHLDLQAAFGSNPALYAFGSGRPWLDDTLIHPTQFNGGFVVAARFARLLEHA